MNLRRHRGPRCNQVGEAAESVRHGLRLRHTRAARDRQEGSDAVLELQCDGACIIVGIMIGGPIGAQAPRLACAASCGAEGSPAGALRLVRFGADACDGAAPLRYVDQSRLRASRAPRRRRGRCRLLRAWLPAARLLLRARPDGRRDALGDGIRCLRARARGARELLDAPVAVAAARAAGNADGCGANCASGSRIAILNPFF